MEVRDGGVSVESYWSHVSDAASMEAYKRNDVESDTPLLSAETLVENTNLLSIGAFVRDFPEKVFPLIYRLRPEFQELFVEYYVLGKGQAFLSSIHGQNQPHICVALQIIEKAIGALIILGQEPDAEIIRPALVRNNLEDTEYGSLTSMIVTYASTQSYSAVAKTVNAPVSAIRKIFRPAIEKLLKAKDIKSISVGSYLHSFTHEASLKGSGLSKNCTSRAKKIHKHFIAPPAQESPLMNFGNIALLKDTPWCMFEIDSDHLIDHVLPALYESGTRIFTKKAGQIFAPLTKAGQLQYGYIFARSASLHTTRALSKTKGLTEASATYDDEGLLKRVITVPHSDVQSLIEQQQLPAPEVVKIGDFVQIKTGEASKYCGIVTEIRKSGDAKIKIYFKSGRRFTVIADATAMKVLKVPAERRAFWGERF